MTATHLLDDAPHRRVLCGSSRWTDATATPHLATCGHCLAVLARRARRTLRAETKQRNEIPRQPGGGR